jgi:hypothetical protein
MSAFPASAMGLPSALKYDLPPSMSDTARSYSVNVAPDGITSVTGAAGNISFTANQVIQSQFSSQVVSFTIPSGMSDSVFLDCMNTTVSFTLTYTVGTAASVTNGRCKLLSNAASWFDTLVLYSNNTPLETVNQYGLLQNFLLQNTVSLSERVGGVSICMGTDANSASGIDLPVAAGSYRFNFCIPLISLIGLNTEKYFPIGSVNNMQLQMTTANLCPIITYCTAVTTNIALTTAPTLNEFRLNLKYLDVGDVAASMLRQTLQDGKWYIKSSTYTNSAVTLPNGSAGNQQALLQIRNSSVKSVFHQFGQSNAVTAQGLVSPNGAYDAINIGTTSRQLQVGGAYFPNLPINDVQRPAEGYAVLIQSLGGAIPKAYGTAVTREMYNSVGGIAAVPTGADNGLVLPATTSRDAPAGSNQGALSVIDYPSGAFYGYDLEKVGGVLFSGLNTRASPPFLNLFLGSALNASVTTQSWGLSDVVMVVDTGSKSVQAFI